MKIMILGGTGMLGYHVFKTCMEREMEVVAVVRNKEILLNRLGNEVDNKIETIDDIKNIDTVEEIISKCKPDYLVNCIGVIKQSHLAENHYESIALNSFLPHQLEKLGTRHGFRLIHISTDCVFDGKKGMYTEEDASNAYDLYGKTKYLGEVSAGCGITIRTSIIGHELTDKKHGLVDWFLSQKDTVKGYTRAIFSGVTTLELTKVILDVIIKDNVAPGLYQVASDPVSKFDLLHTVAGIYHKKIEIIPSEDVILDRSLDGSYFCRLTSYRPPSWRVMLQDMYADFVKK